VPVQIGQCIDPKARKSRDEKTTDEELHHHWERDMANDLHHNDTLWLWAAKAAYIFMEWRMKGVMDLVLHHLFVMGFFDWMGEDTHLNKTTPTMCHMTVMGVSLFHWIVENNIKIMLLTSSGFVLKKLNNVLTQQTQG